MHFFVGGGQYKAISDPIAEQVREIIRPSIEGLLNTFDNDCIAGFESMYYILFYFCAVFS